MTVHEPGMGVASWMGAELDDGVVMLRPWADEDVDQITNACQDPLIQQFIPIPRPYGRADAENYVERTRRQWSEGSKAAFAVVDVSRPELLLGAVNMAVVGSVGTGAYWVAPHARGRGVAQQALRLLADWALDEVGVGVVLLEIHPTNAASIRVAQSAGFHEAGHLEVDGQAAGGGAVREDHLIYSRLASDSVDATSAS